MLLSERNADKQQRYVLSIDKTRKIKEIDDIGGPMSSLLDEGLSMHVLFIGGTNEVGASCLAIQIAGQWIVVDAGVRVDRSTDPLPDFALLENRDVRAIFVTHAHTDHIGALPLLHQAYPTAPIFASRATGLLMEVMLADSQRIMQRRAVEEMELPLYPNDLVERMLGQVRPIPISEAMTIPELEGVTVFTSLAGHIAGAISLGFVAEDGSVVVSGDLSVTEQRTVAGAQPPMIEQPDLLVMESTYGARLHANRQAEEQRLAQAVAGSIVRGGHVLIPSFGLGRGQEVLLLLVDAQQKGQIPEFPIYVDGLVRRVCSTYHLLPEALSPRLTRQIRKGYYPFAGRRITYIKDELDRERVLAGEPACIISSSGMLTGGPSVWYAQRLASDERAAILITSYQDEESPGRKLLDIVERRQDTLELDGKPVKVQCHVDKYSLSAHADAGELASYVASLRPRHVALVHGDDEARAALRARLTDTVVFLPENAASLSLAGKQMYHTAALGTISALPRMSVGISQGREFGREHVAELWNAVSQISTMRIVTARELAHVWDGQAHEGTIARILEVLKQDPRYRYFMPHRALEEAFYIRGKSTSSELFSDLIGQILFVKVAFGGTPMPALCRGLLPTASVRVQFAPGVSDRIRYAYSAILDVLGPLPEHLEERQVASYLTELSRQARVVRRSLSIHTLVNACTEHITYHLSDFCQLLAVSTTDLPTRLAVADLVQRASSLFYVQQMPQFEEGETLYTLAPGWQEALAREVPPLAEGRVDRRAILQTIERHIGTPPDLYRRRFDAETGDVTLSFHFPDIARKRYQQALIEAAEETNVDIMIAPYAHQDALNEVAYQVKPEGLDVQGHGSVYQETKHIHFDVSGQTTLQAMKEAQQRFRELTGWHLTFSGASIVVNAQSVSRFELVAEPMVFSLQNCEEAVQSANEQLHMLPGFVKVEPDEAEHSLIVTFLFPDAARTRHTALWRTIADLTGWSVKIVSSASRDALIEVARRSLPDGLLCVGIPEILPQQKMVRLTYDGYDSYEDVDAARTEFQVTTGWTLSLAHISSLVSASMPPASVPPQATMAQIHSQAVRSNVQLEKPYRMEDALRFAQELLKPLPGYLRVKVDAEAHTLVPRFIFPDIAKQRYAGQLQTINEITGWHIWVHPIIYPLALKDVLTHILPAGLSCVDTPSIYQDKHKVGIICVGNAEREVIETIKQRFLEETGWELELRGSAVEVEEQSVAEPHCTRAEAMQRVISVYGNNAEFYQLGVDDRRYTLWLHFYFPELARMRYKDDLIRLSQETGWHIDVDKDVHQKALVEVAQRLLPADISIVGKKAVLHEQLLLRLNCAGTLDDQQLKEAQQRFLEETGWQLELEFTGQLAFFVSNQGTEQRSLAQPLMSERDALALVQSRLRDLGIVKRPLVDAIRHIFLVHFEFTNGQGNFDQHIIDELEQETGWQIQLDTSVHSSTSKA
ncbi:MBL fold metallo-hydrolase [Ktedonobacteria bacterium brp13]|nr:MBL fold metallo-hydrolase [Ktedonobacteria bacterium brp13]